MPEYNFENSENIEENKIKNFISEYIKEIKISLINFQKGFRDKDYLALACKNLLVLGGIEEMKRRGIAVKEVNDLPRFER